MLKKINKINLIPNVIALIHFFFTFFSDKLIFNLENINQTNYYSCKILLLVVLIFFWNFIWKLFYQKDKELNKYFKYFLLYFIPITLLFLLAYPGTWYGSDVFNFYNYAIEGNFLYYLNYLTSVFYIIGYMLFPCTSGAIILQIILFGIINSYIIKNFLDIYKSKLVYLLYIPFFMFHTIFYVFYANRPVTYGICYLLLVSLLIIDMKKKSKLTNKKLIFISLLTTIVGFWRSESIYLILAIPLFIFLTYKIKFNIKNTIKIVGIVFISFILVSMPQKIEEYKNKSDVPSSRNLPMFVSPLSYMLTQDLKGDDLEENLENIDKVLDVELMKKYASYKDTPAIWMEEGCIKDYTKEEYDLFLKSYINIMKNNIPLFLKTKTLTFTNASGVFVDGASSRNLYINDNQTILKREDTKTLFGYEVRKNTYRLLEGKFSNSQKTNIFYRITGNFLIPMIFIGIIFIYSIIKKQWYYFLLSGMLIGHSLILFLTAPASYFMYYFNVYMCGWIIGIVCIIDFINKKNKTV